MCPVYVFPPTMEGFVRAVYADHNNEESWVIASFSELSTGWKFKYATVGDMAAIDLHRKLVHWIPMHTDVQGDQQSRRAVVFMVQTRQIGTPQCLSAVQKIEFQAKLQNLDDAENMKEFDIKVSEDLSFVSKFKSILDGWNDVQILSKKIAVRESYMKKAFAFDEVRVANASFERLTALGVLMGEEREHAANVFTSRLIRRGTERELEILQRQQTKFGVPHSP